jgi:hypothetical protein
MKKIYYEKRGRRYVPVAEYDNDLLDSFPKGNHLVMSYPGGASRRFNIDPAYAAMIAAGRVAEDAISNKIREATDLRPMNREIDEQTQKRWQEVIKVLPDDMRFMFSHGSARDAAEAGVKAMQLEADKLMKHEGVRKAYEHFQLMCELTKEKQNDYS